MTRHKKSITWSPEARGDLASIWNYYAKAAGKYVANVIVREIVAASRLVGEHVVAGVAYEMKYGLISDL